VDFVTYHMLEALVVGRAKENHYFKFFACKTIVHNLIAKPLISKFVELLADTVNRLTLERCSVSLIAVKTCDLREYALNQMANSHAGGDSMRVNNHVWGYAFNSKW